MLAEALPKRIRYIRLGDEESRYQGVIPVARLPRLLALLAEGPSKSDKAIQPVQALLTFKQDAPHRHIVSVEASFDYSWPCQRCLEEMEIKAASQHELVLSNRSDVIERLPVSVDYLLTEGDFVEVAALLEDQLLLAMPMVPKHEHCEVTRIEEGATETELHVSQPSLAIDPNFTAEPRQRPFANLKKMTTTNPD
ncbi:MAG: DUF177 domain-containing protein [Pseudomonadales bacterium]|jgi:uncharacterized protein|nr:DUF177 domain-containing protein [Pseudomonadales bacterium]MDA0957593.1 DUF177 domain-containing protein [Pseudomonadota bacterium]